MSLVDWRIAWRLQQFEIATFAVGSIALSILAWGLGSILAATAPSVECYRAHLSSTALPPGCTNVEAFVQNQPPVLGYVVAGFFALPFVFGAILGSQVVAREIDRRTAEFAWWAEPSRMVWLAQRVLPLLLVLLVGTTIAAIASTYLESGMVPWIDPRASFHDYGSRGPLLVARAVAAFTVSLLAGSIIGRALPALIVATGLIIALSLSLTAMWPFGQPTEVLPVPIDSVEGSLRADVGIDLAYKSAAGQILTAEQARSIAPPGGDPDSWVAANFQEVWIGVPGERLAEVELRECLMLAAVSSLSAVAVVFIIRRRRPA